MKVALIIGHSEKDGGAYNEKYKINEFEYNKEVVRLLADKICSETPEINPIIIYRDSYSKLPNKVNETYSDIAIEFHLNAAENKSAHGCEMLYWQTSSKGLDLASCFQVNVSPTLGLRDRGIKALRGDSRGGYLLKKTAMPTIITEPFFVSNDTECHKMLKKENVSKLVQSYFDAILQYYEDVFKA